MVMLRLPSPALLALRRLSKESGVSVGQIIRSGVELKLASIVPKLISIAEDSDRSELSQLRAIKYLDMCIQAAQYLGQDGLEIARAKATDDSPNPTSNATVCQ